MARKKTTARTKSDLPVPSADTAPAGYAPTLERLKARIRTAQLQAALSVNQELIRLYWDIGQQIAERQKVDKWAPP